jgi:hypothetical protein
LTAASRRICILVVVSEHDSLEESVCRLVSRLAGGGVSDQRPPVKTTLAGREDGVPYLLAALRI